MQTGCQDSRLIGSIKIWHWTESSKNEIGSSLSAGGSALETNPTFAGSGLIPSAETFTSHNGISFTAKRHSSVPLLSVTYQVDGEIVMP